MHDPILDKLKADAGIVLLDLWRAFRRQPSAEEASSQHPGMLPADKESEITAGADKRPSSLCYFHLN